MSNVIKEKIDYSKVRQIINDYYKSLGRIAKVRIEHKRISSSDLTTNFVGVEWTSLFSETSISSFDISNEEFESIMKNALEDDTKKIISITDNVKVPSSCGTYFDGVIDKSYETDKSFTVVYKEKSKQYVR